MQNLIQALMLNHVLVLSLSIVELKVMLLSVVVKVTSLLNTTAPEYVCVPEVVTDPPRSDAPVIVNAEVPADLESFHQDLMLQRFGLIEDQVLHHLQYLSQLERLLIQLI